MIRLDLDRALVCSVAICALVAAAPAAAEPISPPTIQLAENRPSMMLRGGEPPVVSSYEDAADATGLASAPAAIVGGDEDETQAGQAEAGSDALGRGVNLALPAAEGAAAFGAAADPALLDKAASLAEAAAIEASPLGGFAGALFEAVRAEDDDLRRAYAALEHQSIWFDEKGDFSRAEALIDALRIADAHALPAARYRPDTLAKRLRAFAPRIAEAVKHWPSGHADVAATAVAMDIDLSAAEKGEGGAGADAVAAEVEVEAEVATSSPAQIDPALAELAALERDLTKTYLAFAADLSRGFIDPRGLSKDMDVKRPGAEPAALLLLARDSADIRALAASLPPQTADYRKLLVAYKKLRDAAAQGHDFGGSVVSDVSIRPLDRGAQVDALRARLMAVGDLKSSAPRAAHPETGETLLDRITEAALRRFQSRHGLSVDGVAGSGTKAALNVELSDRVRQLAVNIERARWLNKPMDGRVIQVNIPDFHVDLLQDKKSIFRSRVVVGKRKHQTPEFSDEMTEVIVNPFWHVPYSIATKEYLPKLQQNYKAMARMGIDIFHKDGRRVSPWWVDWDDYNVKYFPFHLRQRPGRGNALGDVKFIFPNKHAVYLHDTPHKRLFSKQRRAFSHGCIRVHKPHRLAKTLLGAQSRNPSALYRNLRAQSQELSTPLRRKVPVHIVYRTAWVEQGVGLNFREDIYGRDAMVAAAMEQAGVVF